MATAIDVSILERSATLTRVVERYRTEYASIYRAIGLTVKLLSNDKAREELALLGVKYANYNKDASISIEDFTQMLPYVDDFIEQIQRVFPIVIVNHTIPEYLMAFHDTDPRATTFDSRNCLINVNGKYICSLKVAIFRYERESWLRLSFWLVCTLVHELAHCFVTYLATHFHHRRLKTPTSINHAHAVPEPFYGESGGYLEGRLFGGYVGYAVDSSHGNRFGFPFLAPEGPYVKQISPTMIKRFIEDWKITLPFETIGPKIPISLIKAHSYIHRLDMPMLSRMSIQSGGPKTSGVRAPLSELAMGEYPDANDAVPRKSNRQQKRSAKRSSQRSTQKMGRTSDVNRRIKASEA